MLDDKKVKLVDASQSPNLVDHTVISEFGRINEQHRAWLDPVKNETTFHFKRTGLVKDGETSSHEYTSELIDEMEMLIKRFCEKKGVPVFKFTAFLY